MGLFRLFNVLLHMRNLFNEFSMLLITPSLNTQTSNNAFALSIRILRSLYFFLVAYGTVIFSRVSAR